MKLIAFRVQNFRSINDSGWIEVRQQTALVGRNESGKTNLLLALQSLNPPNRTLHELSFVKDFPRDRTKGEFNPSVIVVETRWSLSDPEKQQLARVFPRATKIDTITVSRPYAAVHRIGFANLPQLDIDTEQVKQKLSKILLSVRRAIGKFPDHIDVATKEVDTLVNTLEKGSTDPVQWATNAISAIQTFLAGMNARNITISEAALEHLNSLTAYAQSLRDDKQAMDAAVKWVVSRLPIFIFLDEYPELDGHQSIAEYISKISTSKELTEAEKNFAKLVKVAGLDPLELQNLLSRDHEQRQQLANRAGAVVTRKIRELWSDRQLKIRFNLDSEHFDTLVSDPSSAYDVEVNLNERSRGFKWFFSFYITFAADTEGGSAKDAILLLDEPGLFLHGTAQEDLLKHFENDFSNQVIYTTHSPFMIPTGDISSVRTVNISPEKGTIVTNDPTGDERTLFPLRISIGYEVAQAMFIGEYNLVVEGITDYWYLSAISEYFKSIGKDGLPEDLIINPVGGAGKVAYMVTLLVAHRLKALVLLDSDSQGNTVANDMTKTKIIRSNEIIRVGDAIGNIGIEADIEDLLTSHIFDTLVIDAYKDELLGKTPSLNLQVPRIVKRYEQSFNAINLKFNKTRPAKLFLRRIADNPASIMDSSTEEKFSMLFDVIRHRYQTLKSSKHLPFI